MCAHGSASRSALSAGRVRMKSPIAPPRTTRMRFILLFYQRRYLDPATRRWLRRNSGLVMPKRERENHAAVDQRDCVQKAPAKGAPCAPVNLIAQHIWDGDPEQTGQNQQISEYRYEQTAWLVA